MKDQYKTKKQLIEELEVLRNQLVEPKKAETKRKRVEKALKESEQRFRTIFEGAIDGILLADVETKKFRVGNKMICKMLGYSVEEIKNLSVMDIHPKEALPFVMEQFDKLATGEITKTSELPVKRKDGSVFYAEISTVLLKLDVGTYLMGTFRDITERKQAEEALRKSAEQYRIITSTSMDGFAIVDVAGPLLDVNEVYSRMIGYSRDELLKMSVSDIEAKATPEEIQAQHKKTMADSQLFESRHRRKDGRIIDVEVSMTFMRQSGQISVFLRDITERKQAEAALRQSEDKFKYVFDYSVIGNSITLPSGEVNANKALCEMLGYTREELNQKKWQDITHPDDIALTQKALDEIISGKKDSVRLVKKYIHKNGSIVWGDLSTSLRRDEAGKPLYFMSSVVDITERKKAEGALIAARKMNEDIIENANALIMAGNAKNELVIFNKKYEEMTGYEKKEVLGKLFTLLMPKEEHERHLKTFRGVFQNKQIRDYKITVVTKSGEKRITEFNSALISDAEGNQMVVGIGYDITDRKQAEEALQTINERLNYLLTSTSAAIYTAKTSGDYGATSITENVKQVTGYEPREFIENSSFWIDHVHPEDRQRILNDLPRIFEQESYIYEYRFLFRDGNYRWVRDDMKLIRDEFGNPIEIIGYWIDITERKRAEETLQESEERFRLAFENANTGVCLVDLEGNLTRVNAKMCEIFGYTREELERMTVNDIAYPEDIDKSPEFIQKTLQGEIDRGTFEKRYFHKKGHVVTCQVSSSLVRNAEGAPLYFISHLNDITHRKQAEKERERLFEQARASHERLQSLSRRLVEVQEAERRDLVRKLHDEVGQNLTAMSINLNIIRSQLDGEMSTKIVPRLDDSMKLVEGTVERIRDVMAELRPPVLDDYGLTAALHWYSKRFSERTGISPVLQVEELTQRLPLSTETALFRIAQEALTNVAKYARAKQVTLALEEIDGGIHLTVADDGVGFNLTTHHKPARPEWGLINMIERAEAIGGQFSLESTPGKGTRVVVEVPR
jgi:PAS domain S-box-containing protein